MTNSKDNTIAVIDLKTNTVVGKLSQIGLDGPEAVSIDSNTNKAYMANFQDNTVQPVKLAGSSYTTNFKGNTGYNMRLHGQ